MKSKTYANDTAESLPLPDQNGSMRKNLNRSAVCQERTFEHNDQVRDANVVRVRLVERSAKRRLAATSRHSDRQANDVFDHC